MYSTMTPVDCTHDSENASEAQQINKMDVSYTNVMVEFEAPQNVMKTYHRVGTGQLGLLTVLGAQDLAGS